MAWPFQSASSRNTGLNPARLVVVTSPATEPVTLAEAKLWLRVDDDADDDLIAELITAARGIIEELTSRALVSTTYRAEWDQLPAAGMYQGAATIRELVLPRGPLVSVAWIKYSADDASGTETTFDAANYTVGNIDRNRLGRLWVDADSDWPTLGDFPGALRCQFVAGYGAAALVPAELKVAVKLLLTHLYQNRAPVNVGNIVNEIPFSLAHLIAQHKLTHL